MILKKTYIFYQWLHYEVDLGTAKSCRSGGHLYRNGALERIENEYGYWADSCYHYRITDYQGNVRAVISQNGVLERSST